MPRRRLPRRVGSYLSPSPSFSPRSFLPEGCPCPSPGSTCCTTALPPCRRRSCMSTMPTSVRLSRASWTGNGSNSSGPRSGARIRKSLACGRVPSVRPRSSRRPRAAFPRLQQELNAAKRVARTALEAIEKAHDERCTQVWRECPLMSPRIERDGTGRGASSGRLLDPFGCEARKNSCVLGARSTETSSLRSLLGSNRVEDLAGIDVGGLPETQLQTDRGVVTLRSSVEQLVFRSRQMPMLRARRDSAEDALQVAQTELEAQRKAVGQIETSIGARAVARPRRKPVHPS